MQKLDAAVRGVAILKNRGIAPGHTRDWHSAGPIGGERGGSRDDGGVHAEALGGASGVECGASRDSRSIGE